LADDRPVGTDGTDTSTANAVLRKAEREVRGAIKKFQTLQAGSLLEAGIIAELWRAPSAPKTAFNRVNS